MLSPAELRRWDDCSLPDAVLAESLDSRPDSMDGRSMLGCCEELLDGELLDDELLDGELLAVCGWLRLEELLLDDELDCDWDGELEDDCDGCAGGCDWVCWLLQPTMAALNTVTETSVRQPIDCRIFLRTAFLSVILFLLRRPAGAVGRVGLRRKPGRRPADPAEISAITRRVSADHLTIRQQLLSAVCCCCSLRRQFRA